MRSKADETFDYSRNINLSLVLFLQLVVQTRHLSSLVFEIGNMLEVKRENLQSMLNPKCIYFR